MSEPRQPTTEPLAYLEQRVRDLDAEIDRLRRRLANIAKYTSDSWAKQEASKP